MRTTIHIPQELIDEAIQLTGIKTKTKLVRVALENLIQKEKVQGLTDYFGQLNLDINIRNLRDRDHGIN